jgi:hypothetical protein
MTLIIHLNGIDQLVFVMETQYFSSDAETGFLNIILCFKRLNSNISKDMKVK